MPRYLAALIVLVPGAAHADEFSLHALLTTQTAVTTNAFSTPDDVEVSSDPSINYQIRPGVLFSYHTRRSLHELSVDTGLDGNDFTSNVTLTYRGAWRMTYSLTPRTEGEAGASVSGGRVNALASSAPANMGTPGVLPTGQVEFLQADASESVSYQVSPLLSIRQNVFGRYLRTDTGGDPPPPPALPPVNTRGAELGAGLSAERSFQVTALSLQAQGTFQRLGQEELGSGVLENRDQLDARMTARVRRDFSLRWSGSIEGGVVALVPLDAGDELVWQPIGSLDVAYFPSWGAAGLSVRHSVAPNLFLAQNEITDSATINAALPLPYLGTRQDPKLMFLTSTGFSHTRFISLEDGGNIATFNVLYSDVAVQYSPKPNYQLSLRYQFVRQSDTDSAVADPMLAQLGYIRHTVMFTFAGRWPERLAAEIPLRQQIRVRSITPVGGDSTTGISGGGGAER